jgi:hypothetical protein
MHEERSGLVVYMQHDSDLSYAGTSLAHVMVLDVLVHACWYGKASSARKTGHILMEADYVHARGQGDRCLKDG